MSDLRCDPCKQLGGPKTLNPAEQIYCQHTYPTSLNALREIHKEEYWDKEDMDRANAMQSEISALKLELEKSKARCEEWQAKHRTCAEKLTSAEVERDKFASEYSRLVDACRSDEDGVTPKLAIELINVSRELSETQARMEEARYSTTMQKYYKELAETWSDRAEKYAAKLIAQDKVIERVREILDLPEKVGIAGYWENEYFKDGWNSLRNRIKKAFLGEIGKP